MRVTAQGASLCTMCYNLSDLLLGLNSCILLIAHEYLHNTIHILCIISFYMYLSVDKEKPKKNAIP